jgi:hypothetical protein
MTATDFGEKCWQIHLLAELVLLVTSACAVIAVIEK